MNRSRIFLVLVCLAAVLLLAVSPASHVPRANTKQAVMAYVQDAAKIVQKSGPSCATFASNEWKGGDYYIFVIGPDQKTVCHPNPEMVGKPSGEIVNAKGDKVGEKIVKMGMADGKGWVDYLWNKPGKTNDEPKSSYVMGVAGPDGKHYVVGAGGWDLK
ncbi:MAG TPA: cache domain-containing protein [Thermoanaerobaculia bacterium]|nr:cache domain-containing protein [Thermoanaerobaculia bacterium]